jgi:hypothetical protein
MIDYGHISKDKGAVSVATVNQQTLAVESHSPEAVRAEDWEPLDMGGDTDYLLGRVQCNDDGLRYQMVIEIMDWAEATGETKTVYELRLSDQNDPLHGQRFRTQKQAEEHIAGLPALIELLQDEGFAHPDDLPDLYTKIIAEVDEPQFMVCLYVVPVSVPREIIATALGQDIEEWMLAARKKHGDWRENTWDIHSYGHHVPIALKGLDGAMANGVLVDETQKAWAIEQAQATATVVQGLFGFYMDRVVNGLGETGWDWLHHAKAFPGQHESKPKTKSARKRACDDCGEKSVCTGFKTTYGGRKHYLCERCAEQYYTCAGCGVLVPIEPQSYAGVEWTQIDDEYYCRDCATKVYNGKDCPKTVAGGRQLTLEDIRDLGQNLSNVRLPKWRRVDDEDLSVGWYSQNVSEQFIANQFIAHIAAARDTHEFILGVTEHQQFQSSLGLFTRRRHAGVAPKRARARQGT